MIILIIFHPYFDICGNVLVTKTNDYDEYQVHDILVHHKHNTNDLLSDNTYKIYVLEEPKPEQEPEPETEPEPEPEQEPEQNLNKT